MENRLWIDRARTGDCAAKEHLFYGTIQDVYYLCWRLTGSSAQAAELTRRTYACAFSSLGELRPGIRFERWMTVIAVNLCRQAMRKTHPRLFSTDERENAMLNRTADEACLPPECAADPNLRAQALQTINLLPPEQRVAMILRYAALLNPHQIAKLMDVDDETVLGRLCSGRQALRTSLPCSAPKALLTTVFAAESAALPVPKALREECLQIALNAQPEPSAPQPSEAQDAPVHKGFFSGLLHSIVKIQKYAFFGGMAAEQCKTVDRPDG